MVFAMENRHKETKLMFLHNDHFFGVYARHSQEVCILSCTSDKKVYFQLHWFGEFGLLKFLCLLTVLHMETRYKETNLLWPYFTKHEMKFCQVLS